MKNNNSAQDSPSFFSRLLPRAVKKGPALAWAAAFALCLAAVLANQDSSRNLDGNLRGLEAGMVADRDIIAEQTITYIDERATGLRIDAQERLVPAVFRYSYRATEEQRGRWNRFSELSISLQTQEQSRETFRLNIQAEFPGSFPDDALDLLYDSGDRELLLHDTSAILQAVFDGGIYSIPQTGLERLNPDVLELIRQSSGRIEQERIPLRSVVTRASALEAAAAYAAAGGFSPEAAHLAPRLLEPFLRENVFFAPEDTQRRIAEARDAAGPVLRTVEQGTRVIKRGFIITEEELADMRALRMALSSNDFRSVAADMLFLLMLMGLVWYFSGVRIIGRTLRSRESYLVAGLSALYITGSVLARNVSLESFPVAVVVPTALVILLPAILIHARLALVLAMALPLGAFLTGSFDTPSYIFALVSGIVAAYSLQGAEKRMDLVRAGLIIAAANLLAMTAVLLWQRFPAAAYPPALFWAVFNGVASGMLVLGILPPLENALNAATSFRLIELSDLNAPPLKRLFTVAPGTYSHSIIVANLAETACIDIGANALLARVGAYYHDLGKMENPDYFVENQTDYNRHDDMAPRLSATVIRSHVKLGVEKARQLNLPREVIDVIGEHHGNSVISWFYDKALKTEGADRKKNPGKINMEDFSYPGNPPRSRESAVVMLADVTEAAARTIDKPAAVKIEKLIQELIAAKVEHGQLAQSELTFRDLETIKNAFLRVLVAYYHSRIEYPKAEAAESPAIAEAAKQ